MRGREECAGRLNMGTLPAAEAAGADAAVAMTVDRGALTREFRLLLSCCRLETGDAVTTEIRSLLDADLDWNRLIEWAVWHQVSPLLHRTLDRVAPEKVPPAIAHALRVNYQGWVEYTDKLWSELRRVLDGLAQGGVSAIPFKGPVLARSIYGEMALRPFSDLDFLLRPDDVDRALTILETLSYRLPSTLSPSRERYFRRFHNQYLISRGDAKVLIEPHWALTQHIFAVHPDQEALWERAVSIDIDGYRVRRFAPRDELLVLCIHGFTEQWRRLKWICDIAEFVRANRTIDWDALLREASAVGCARILVLGLVLAHDLLDAPVPDRVFAHRDSRLEGLIAHVHGALFKEKIEDRFLFKPNAFYFHARERPQDRVRYVLRRVLAPRPVIIELVRLPDSLLWAYYPARWIHDYLMLPPWLVWKRFRSLWRGRG